MRLNRLALLFSALVALGLNSTTFDQKELEALAEQQGYGYKAANLMFLKRVLQDVGTFRVQVPDFAAVSSDTIQSLCRESGLDITKEWLEIVQNLDLEQSLKTRRYPSWFLDASRAFAEKIREHFKFIDLRGFSNEDIETLRKLLLRAQNDRWQLMVRSTGKEDTDKLANAGGNLSVANVSPNEHIIFVSVGQVIASYFEEKSLSQRLIAGDTTIDDNPLTPVLIQRMVGEEINNTTGDSNPLGIPVGCVLYTSEPAARVDIHTLQCSFGHNEGVVQSLVPLDTFYLTKDKTSKSIIKFKPKRIAPVFENGIFALEEVSNPLALQSQPTLNKEAAQAISKVGDQIDDYYQKRMDIELIFEPKTETLFIVQARPLVFPSREELPSYIARLNEFKQEQIASLTPVEIGTASVQRITRAEQVLIANTLDDALELYTRSQPTIPDAAPHAVEMMEPPVLEDPEPIAENERTNLRKTVKIIIVARQADATSHAAAVFRGDKKTIYIAADLRQISEWLKESPVDILVDGQRGFAVNLSNSRWHNFADQFLFEQRVLKGGWINYPLPLRVSVDAHLPKYCVAPKKNSSPFDNFTCLVDQLQDAASDLEHFVEVTRVKAHCNESTPGCLEERVIAQEALPKLENLNTLAHQIKAEMRATPDADDVGKLLDLFPKRFLEALIYQQPNSEFVGSYSFESVQQDYQRRQDLVLWELKPLIDSGAITDRVLRDENLFLVAEKAAAASLTIETTTRFLQLLDDLATTLDAKRLAQLNELVDALDTLSILPLWLNSLFMESAAEIDKQCRADGIVYGTNESFLLFQKRFGLNAQANHKLLDKLYQDYTHSRAQLLALADKKASLKAYDISRFERPQNFAKSSADLKERFISYFVSPDFLNFKTPLYQIAAVSLMESFVERFDRSIKVLKSARTYPNKVANFKLLLEDYFSVLSAWAPLAPQDHIFYNPEAPLKAYLGRVHDLLLAKTDLKEDELLPTPDFSVSGAALGSGTNFVYYKPETLEDLFTLIHQSLNAVMSAYIADYATRLKTPPEFEHTRRAVYLAEGHPFPKDQLFVGHNEQLRVILTGVYIDNHGVTYNFNLPLRWHSAKLYLSYIKETQQVNMRLDVLGESSARWQNVAAFCEIKCDLLQIQCPSPRVSDQEMMFNFDSIGTLTSSDIKDIIIGAIDLTLERPPLFSEEIKYYQKQIDSLLDDYISQSTETSLAKAQLLVSALLKEGRYTTTLQSIVRDHFGTASPTKQEFNFFVLKELVNNNLEFELAESICAKLLTSKNASNVNLSITVLKALVQKGRATELAGQIALREISKDTPAKRQPGLQILTELVRKGNLIDEGENLVKISLKSDNGGEKYYALELLEQLVEKGRLLDDAEELTRSQLDSKEWYLHYRIVQVAIALVKHDKALSFARELIERYKDNDDPWMRRAVEKLRDDIRSHSAKDEL